jgi:hypothetical protein
LGSFRAFAMMLGFGESQGLYDSVVIVIFFEALLDPHLYVPNIFFESKEVCYETDVFILIFANLMILQQLSL